MPYVRHKVDGSVMHVNDPDFWTTASGGYERIGDKVGKAAVRGQAVAKLREMLQPDSVVYCVLRRVSTSGMSRVIDLVVIVDNRPVSIAHYARDVLGWKYTNDRVRGLVVTGCGMDMGFHTVDALGRALGYAHADKGVSTLRTKWL